MSEESPEVVLKKETKNSVPLIKIRNARKWFPIKAGLFSPVSAHVRAVDGVDLDIQRGETVGIVGESGCGKTTLGRLVMGLIPMTEGTIQFGGKDIGEINRKELRRRLQIVFQDPGGSMNPRMSVRSIIGEPLLVNGLADGAELTKKVAELLSIVGLQPNLWRTNTEDCTRQSAFFGPGIHTSRRANISTRRIGSGTGSEPSRFNSEGEGAYIHLHHSLTQCCQPH